MPKRYIARPMPANQRIEVWRKSRKPRGVAVPTWVPAWEVLDRETGKTTSHWSSRAEAQFQERNLNA